MAGTYTCEACGGTFTEGWTDAAANAEARAVFGVDHEQDPTMAVVCDDCYRLMTAAIPPKDFARKQQIVDILNQRYATSLSLEMVEIAVAYGFTSWQALLIDALLVAVDPHGESSTGKPTTRDPRSSSS
jgi:hypothetical protein